MYLTRRCFSYATTNPIYQDIRRQLRSLMDEAFASSKKMNLNFLPSCYLYKTPLGLSLKDIVIDIFNTEKALEEIYREKHSILGLWQCIGAQALKLADGS